jgi:hypothetical protein
LYICIEKKNNLNFFTCSKVSVFDFSLITERTETRVRDDLLGAGPKSVHELRAIAERLRVKYQTKLDLRITKALQDPDNINNNQIKDVMDKGIGLAGGLLSKMKSPGAFSTTAALGAIVGGGATKATTKATTVDLPDETPTEKVTATASSKPDVEEQEGDWLGSEIAPPTEAISNFSIGDDDDEDTL